MCLGGYAHRAVDLMCEQQRRAHTLGSTGSSEQIW